MTWLLGGVLTGVLYWHFTIGAIFVLDGITFLLSGLSEMFMNIPKHTPHLGDRSLRDVLSWRVFHKTLRERTLVALVVYKVLVTGCMAAAFRVVTPYLASEILKLTAIQFGFFESLLPAGAAMGALLHGEKNSGLNKRIAVNTLGLSFCCFSLMCMAFLALLGFAKTPFVFASLLLFGSGIGQVELTVMVTTHYQGCIGEEARGGFFGLKTFIVRFFLAATFLLYGTAFYGKVRMGSLIVSLTLAALGLWFLFKDTGKSPQKEA